jgi:hypothetical protein
VGGTGLGTWRIVPLGGGYWNLAVADVEQRARSSGGRWPQHRPDRRG